MAAKFCVDCGLPLTGRYCGACGRDYGATDAAQRASCPLATVQQDSSSTAGAQQEVAEAQQDVSSSTAGAQPAVSPASRPCAREGGVRAHGAPRSLSAPAATRGRGPGAGAGPAAGGVAPAGGFTLSKNITSWRDGPMGCLPSQISEHGWHVDCPDVFANPGPHSSQKMLLLWFPCRAFPTGQATHSSPCSS